MPESDLKHACMLHTFAVIRSASTDICRQSIDTPYGATVLPTSAMMVVPPAGSQTRQTPTVLPRCQESAARQARGSTSRASLQLLQCQTTLHFAETWDTHGLQQVVALGKNLVLGARLLNDGAAKSLHTLDHMSTEGRLDRIKTGPHNRSMGNNSNKQ